MPYQLFTCWSPASIPRSCNSFVLAATAVVNAVLSAASEATVRAVGLIPLNGLAAIHGVVTAASTGAIWATLMFLLWGALGALIFALAHESGEFSVDAFTATGFLAGLFLVGFGTISWYLGEVLLSAYSVADLYDLAPLALARLYGPAFIYGDGAGGLILLDSGHLQPLVKLASLAS